MKSVVVTLWDGTDVPFTDVEISIPTPGIYRVVVGEGQFVEYPFSSIKFITIYEKAKPAPLP